MRWTKTTKGEPRVGYTRSVRRFLFFPKCINNEWRWLEFARIVQKYVPSDGLGLRWADIYWVNDEKNEIILRIK